MATDVELWSEQVTDLEIELRATQEVLKELVVAVGQLHHSLAAERTPLRLAWRKGLGLVGLEEVTGE